MSENNLNSNTGGNANIFTVEFDVNPHSTALVIIDMQKNGICADFGLGRMWLENIPDQAEYWFSRLRTLVVPNIQKLLMYFRARQYRVIFIRVGPYLPDGSDMIERRRLREETAKRMMGLDRLFKLGSPELEIIDELKPVAGELVIDKNSASAFNSSNIDQLLHNLGIDSLVLTGVATNACVETTARDAADRGYKCILVDDACATFHGQDVHDMTMRNFSALFGKVMKTEGVIQSFDGKYQ
ncbi:MAG: cysteine hydrolase [Dehalococcoidales bacterium]|nr:cysteine hydrolase [Dehalococcoidales bacterium]